MTLKIPLMPNVSPVPPAERPVSASRFADYRRKIRLPILVALCCDQQIASRRADDPPQTGAQLVLLRQSALQDIGMFEEARDLWPTITVLTVHRPYFFRERDLVSTLLTE